LVQIPIHPTGNSYVLDRLPYSFLFQVVNPPALQVAASAYTVMWNEKGNIPWAVDSYREEGRRSNVNRVFTHLKPTIVSTFHGYLLLDTVA